MSEQRRDGAPGKNLDGQRNHAHGLKLQQHTFQGGSDGLTEPPTHIPTYGDMKYKDDEGPFAEFSAQYKSAGLSGTEAASTGLAPALFNDPDAAESQLRPTPGRSDV